MTEKDLLNEFKQYLEKEHPNWRVKSEVPVGDLVADGRIDEIDEKGIVRDIIAYLEIKSQDADLKDLLTGLAQAQYYREQTLRETWLVLSHEQLERLMTAKKKGVGGIKLYDINEKKLVDYESVVERMSKSRMKRAQEKTIHTWSQEFTIQTTTPLAITEPVFNEHRVLFNLGQRIRGMLKEVIKTISPSLAESIKYSIYVEPVQMNICTKKELTLIIKYIPTSRGQSTKREMYEIPSGKRLTFTVRCISRKITPELLEDLIRQGGMFSGIGDAHRDGFHGRFILLSEKPKKKEGP